MEKGLARNSLEAYGRDLAGLRAFAEAEFQGAIPEEEALNRYLNGLYQKDLSSRTIARHLSAVRNLYHFLCSEEAIGSDPTEHLARSKQWAKIPKFLNREQIEKLVAAPDVSTNTGLRDRAMLEFLYATGTRVTELIQLQLSQIDFGLGLAQRHRKRQQAAHCSGPPGRAGGTI